MKTKIKLLLLTCTLSLSLGVVSGQGIEFFKGGFDAAIKKSVAENKILFIDFYADWCGPCKRMVTDVFPNAKLGEYFRDRIVAIQLNSEAPENKLLVKRFSIKSIPTLVFLDAQDKVLSNTSGALPVEGLLRQARIATGESPEFSVMYEKYRASKNDPALARQVLQDAPGYLNTLEGMEREKWQVRIEKVFSDYCKQNMGPDMINAEDYRLIYMFDPSPKQNDELAEFMVKNIQAFIDHVGTAPAYYVMDYNTRVMSDLARQGNLDYKKWLDRIDTDMKPAYAMIPAGNLSHKERSGYLMDGEYVLFAKKDAEGYVELTEKYLTCLGQEATANSYAEASQKVYRALGHKVSRKVNEKAKEWIITALQFEENPLLDKINYLTMLGDTNRELKEYGEAKKCYNQAYMETYQLPGKQMQMMTQMGLRRKLSQLELFEQQK